MALSLKQKLSQKQKLAPKQVLQAKLLQLSTVNLEQEIIFELEKNPVLEQVEQDDGINQEELDETPIDDLDVSLEDMYTSESSYYISENKNEMPIASRYTFIENMIKQLNDLELDDRNKEIAEEILWNLNDQGYLDTELILIADRYELLEEEIEPILFKIQRLDPKGLASRNLQECLLIQIEEKKETLEYKILNDYFDDFMHKRYEKMCNKLNCNEEELQNAIKHITQLNPRPGEGHNDKFQTIIPDIIVSEDGDDWVISTNDNGLPELRISQLYKNQVEDKKIDSKAKKFIKNKIDSANWFIEAVNQRRITLVNVMRSIIEFQPEWFSGNVDFLRPLKLQDIAEKINMDISTVSRSTRGKYVDTPYGIFELKYFLSDFIKLKNGLVVATFNIKKALEKIILQEDKNNPLNDDVLVSELEKQNYKLARRTVAKYRDNMGYPVARLRKKI